jgi:hypothetical protein
MTKGEGERGATWWAGTAYWARRKQKSEFDFQFEKKFKENLVAKIIGEIPRKL